MNAPVLSTLEGQRQHYAGIKARLWGAAPIAPLLLPAPVATPEAVRMPEIISDAPAPLNMLNGCSWRFLLAYAALRHDQSAVEIASPSRRRAVATARHLAVYLIARHTSFSIARIGRYLGRDHTTILNSLSKFPAFEREHVSRYAFDHDIGRALRRSACSPDLRC